MSADTVFPNTILNEIVSKVNEETKNQLQLWLKNNETCLQSLRNELQQQKTNSDKQVALLQKELQNACRKLEMSDEFNTNLKKQLREMEDVLQKLRKDFYDILSEKESLKVEYESSKQRMERSVQEKIDLNFIIECKTNELISLQEDLKSTKNKLQSSLDEKLQLTLRAEELELKEWSLQQKEERMKQEKELLMKQINSLNETIAEKSTELNSVRREKSMQLLKLQSVLEQKTDEVSVTEEEVTRLKQVIERKDKHVENLSSRIREMQECSVELESHYQSEILAQNRVIEAHKKSIEEEKKRTKQLFETIEEMQSMLQAAKQAHVDLEQVYNNAVLVADQRIKIKDDNIKSLKSEIEELKSEISELSRKSLQSEIEGFFPAASSTSKVFQANMTLSQVYSELVKLRERLEASETENERLKDQMQQIINEAEERGPFVYRKINEYEKAVQMVSNLQTQLSRVNLEKERIEKERESLQSVFNHSQRECKRLEKENKDLSTQVRCLIKAVHEARGYFVQDSDISSSDDVTESSSSKIISLHLVTFKDIESLQIQNQKLLSAVRELSEKQEELEANMESDENNRLKQELEKAVKEIESLRKERRQQSEVLDCLTNQKDINKSFSPSNENTGDISAKSTSFAEETLADIKKNVDKLTDEYSNYKREAHEKIEELNKELIECRHELSNVKLDRAKYISESEHLKEKLDVLQTNLDQFKNSSDANSKKNIKLSEKLKKSEELVENTRQELLTANEIIAMKDSKLETLQSECNVLKSNEMNLLQERKTALQQQQEKSRLMATLQSLQSSLEKMEFESCQKYKVDLENKIRENNLLKNKFEREKEEIKAHYANLETNSKELQQKLNEELNSNHKLAEGLASTKIRLSSVEYELNIMKQEKASEKIESVEKATSTERSLQSLKLKEKQLTDSQSEVKSLREKLLFLQKSFDGQKSVTSSLEDKLNEQNKLAEEQKLNFDKLLIEKEKEVAQQKEEKIKRMAQQAKLRIANITKSKEVIVSEKEELAKQIEEKDKRIASLEQMNEEYSLRLRTLQSQYEARMRKQEKDLTEAQENYSLKSKEVELLQSQLQSQNTISLQVSSSQQASSSVVSPPVISAAPLRHPVLPQQQQHSASKSTPTASIRPLPVSLVPRVTVSRPSTSSNRAATVVAVQPTTDESASQHVQVPQATVTPTQTVPTMVMVAPTTTVVESVLSTSSFPVAELVTEASEQMQSDQNASEEQIETATNEAIVETNNDNEQPTTSTQSPTSIAKRTHSPVIDVSTPKKRRVIESVETVEREEDENADEEKGAGEDNAIEENVVQEQHDSSDDIIVLESDDDADDNCEEDDEEADDADEEEDDDEEENQVKDENSAQYEEENSGESISEGRESEDEYGDQEFDANQQESSQQGDYSEENNADRSQEIEIVSSENEAPIENQEHFNQEMPILRNESESIATLSADQQASASPAGSFMQAPPPLQRTFSSAVRGESRLTPVARQSLYFAHGMQHGAAFDEGDDGIVPSTPTLCVPRRGEGFVEALNSPRVPQNRFVFLHTSETSSGLAQLASQGALGMDDTRMDLSQFDESTNNGKTSNNVSVEEICEPHTSGDGSQNSVAADVVPSSVSSTDENESQSAVCATSEERETVENKKGADETECKETEEIVISGDLGADSEGEVEAEETEVTSHLEELSGDEAANEETVKLSGISQEISDNVKSDETKPPESTSAVDVEPSPGPTPQRSQTARRARRGQSAMAPSGPRTLQRRPVVWESTPSQTQSETSTTATTTTVTSTAVSHGGRIRLRGSRYSMSTGRSLTHFRGGRQPRGGRRGAFY